ncbi:hypothetical protein C7455_102187 [Roseicyclus mahoneyensis]|uniref:Uncharacterized protein n=1 Tax=Roseicyclus mahoneyensis TaxID=164332 RepID=A0A316GK54_9RHOB|nr:hypothetical protein C7455_102187 [Roseicyclus mahoneyensis]
MVKAPYAGLIDAPDSLWLHLWSADAPYSCPT